MATNTSSRNGSQRPSSGTSSRRGKHRRSDRSAPQRPVRQPAGTIALTRVEWGTRFHVAECSILAEELHLPSAYDLRCSLTEHTYARARARSSFDAAPRYTGRPAIVEYRTPALLSPSMMCTCVRTELGINPGPR